MVIVTAVIQARVGSSRLPGKVMYPLDGSPVLEHVIERVIQANRVDDIVVATTTEPPDDVLADYAPEFGADVIRGSEQNVLSRFERATEQYEPDIIVRVTGDCPLVSPKFIDTAIERLRSTSADFVSAGVDWTFPRGTTCEVFTASSFQRVAEASSDPQHLEHVTLYYHNNPDEFDLRNLPSSELFEDERFQNRTDLRLTLDEPEDYRLLETVYREVEHNELLNLPDVIDYIDQNELVGINESVNQKSPDDDE